MRAAHLFFAVNIPIPELKTCVRRPIVLEKSLVRCSKMLPCMITSMASEMQRSGRCHKHRTGDSGAPGGPFKEPLREIVRIVKELEVSSTDTLHTRRNIVRIRSVGLKAFREGRLGVKLRVGASRQATGINPPGMHTQDLRNTHTYGY